ncbi:SCP-like extracellular protein [Phytophthora palmivora]|uniref:SCP-like extracellular protein n=1 Tax=Phytophthora palmivora TaxID=4796 RepID=A0A2P4YK98_9STRA|nr:SCP-like extracellular protein [Phytophthora palmivora]
MVAIIQYSVTLLLALTTVSATNLRQENRDLSEMTYSQSSEFAAALLARVNKERLSHGLPALCSNKKLQAAAQRHAKDQSKTDYMSDTGTDDSTPKQRVTEAGYKWQSVGENIDSGNINANAVVDWWMKNESRENILGKYTMTGTAYVYNENTYSKHYWVQVFATGSSEECDA